MLTALFLSVVAGVLADPCSLLLHAPTLELAQATIDEAVFQDPGQYYSYRCVKQLIDKGAWEVAELLSAKTVTDDSKLTSEVKKRATDQKKQIDRFIKSLNFDPARQFANAPVLQWAQSPDKLFLDVTWAHRFDSPGCLQLADRKVDITETRLELSGICKQGNNREKYELKFDLFGTVEPETSTKSFDSKGRTLITLQKKEKGVWEAPMKGANKPPNIKIWTEMKERYARELSKFTEEQTG